MLSRLRIAGRWEMMSFSSAFFLADEGGTCLPDTWAAGVAPSLDSKSLGCAVINAMLCCHCLNAQSKTKTKQSWLWRTEFPQFTWKTSEE